ncbi:hypothetical protein SRHO_G00014920 [Serrasalmus rhombeus]
MASLQPAIVLLLLLTLACGLRQGSVMIETLNSEQAIDPSEGTLDEGGAEQQGGSAEGQRYLVFCGEDAVEVVLPPGSLSEMQVFDSSGMYPVFGLPEACDYSLTRENGRVVLHVHFAGCPVTVEEGSYTLRFLYRNSAGQLESVTVSCSNSSHAPSSKTRSSRHPVLSYPAVKISPPQAVQLYFPYWDPLSPTAGEPVSVPQPDPLPPAPGAPLTASPLDLLFFPEFDPLFPTPGVPLPAFQWEQPSPTPTSMHVPAMPSSLGRRSKCKQRGVQPPTSQWEQLSPTPTSMQVTAMPSSLALHSNFKKGGCSFPSGQRLPCGRPGTTAAECLRKGCCRDEATFACYYPMDVCLADRQFIFVVPSNVAGLPINPARLMVVGRSSCKPVIANRDFAVFKFGVTECGTHSYQIGETTVYLAEVQSPIRKRVLQYGIITRDIPVRLMVECRYSKSSLDLADSPVLADPLAPQASQSRLMKGWASAGYMVKSASLPALVRAKGLYGVQLRIAQDETFTKFCSEDHQPLKVLLGKPVYLELRINAPNPKATLVVHYCVAYPRSAKSALVLLYEGLNCPNPLDSDNISILYVAGQSQDPHVRRFEVKAFQFMDKSTNKYLNEEIYFMCSTEVCMPSQTPCKETCFDGKPAIVLLLLLTLACGLRQGSVMIETLNSEQAIDPSEGTLDEGGAEQQGGSAEGQRYLVFCGEDAVEVVLPPGSLSEMQVFDSSGMYPVFGLPEACDYSLTRENGRVVLHVHFAGCPVTVEEGSYTLRFLYRNSAGQLEIVTVSCSNSSHAPSSKTRSSRHPVLSYPAVKISPPQAVQLYFPYWDPLSPTAGEPVSVPQPDPLPPAPGAPLTASPLDLLFFPEFDPLFPTPGVPLPAFQWEQPSPTPTSMHVPAMPSSLGRRSKCKQRGCSFPSGQRLPCGRPGTTAAECLRKGCCRDEATFACYYPMDVCLADRQFIFVVPSNVAGLPINPARLMVVGRSSCKPVIANRDFAVFKFGVTECGTHSYQIGETTVYLAEVQSPIRKRVLQYGIITRDIPVRLMVECRYSKSSLDLADSPVLADPLAPQASQSRLMKGWASAGYMVKSASLPALVRAKGLYGVQLRIAQDETFTKFCSEDHQPLKVLLGKPVYLELRINAPNPKATLVVHYCVAYPRSAKSALVLLYEGCPNPLDSDNISILYVAGQSQDPHVRRFEVKAFQFMDKSTNKYLNEEIYFMCSTEVCMPSQTPCKETCFDGKSSSTTAADVLNSYSQLKVKHF